MPKGDTNRPFHIGTWLVEPALNRVSDGDQVVALESRLMGTLVCLASRPGKIVSADKLLETVWHGRAHGDNSIYQAVAQLRKVLGDHVNHPRFIETIPKKGYRLICPVVPVVIDDDLHATSGTGFGRRFVTLTAGIALFAVAITLMVNPEFRERLMPSADTPREKSVAVLPFVDMSQDGNQQYLSDGVTEELIHVLSNLPDLRVTARTSSFAFRDSNEDIRQIGSKLNVATILEGSIRKDGDRIRVTSQLVDTRNGYHLWSQTFDRRTTDLFSIQNEIAVAVAKTFEYRELDGLTTDYHAARQEELQSYDLYLLGLHHSRKDTLSSHLLAIQYFERAIEMDPSFARAYAGLSDSYASRYWAEINQDLLNKAESAAEYALLLDDQSAEAFVALGHTKIIKRDYAGAEMALKRALELNPNDARAYSWLIHAYRRQDRKEEAFAILQKVLELNPMSGELNSLMGLYVQELRGADWDTVFMYWKRAIERDPDHPLAYIMFGRVYRSTGQLDQAIPYFNKVVDLTTGPTKVGGAEARLTSIYIDIGDYKSAAEVIRRTRELEPDNFDATNSEIHLLLSRGNFSAARDMVHRMLSKHIDSDSITGLMAFYEMLIGDTNHAEEIYARLAAAQEPSGYNGEVNLYRRGELSWGMMGAVNLAYLHKRNGQNRAAEELIRKAREFIESESFIPLHVGTIPYVHAQIAAIEGNNDGAIEYFRKAADGGWTRAWFGRIDPIMADLRKDVRYTQILEEVEDKLLQMRDRSTVLVSNEP